MLYFGDVTKQIILIGSHIFSNSNAKCLTIFDVGLLI